MIKRYNKGDIMAKKKNERVVIEDIELKPQVIGYTYKKKSNIGRVIFLFIVFILVVFYINDISVFINNLLGKKTASTINNNKKNKDKFDKNDKDDKDKEVVYNIYSTDLQITEENFTLNNFNLINNVLSFDILNNTENNIDLKDKKYYIEIYSQEKTLLERHKINIKAIASNAKISYELNIKNNFYYIVLIEKGVNDYPNVVLTKDDLGNSILTCIKERETIVYTFINDSLNKIEDTIEDNDTTRSDYYTSYTMYQNKATNYNNIEGVSATFNSTLNGYRVVFALDLQKVNLNELEEIYYYGYKELPKVVKFEMEANGFSCN